MSEYIERSRVLAAIQSRKSPTRSPAQNEMLRTIRVDVNHIPAADVVEVRHGRWELVTTKYFPGRTVRVGYCQKCNEERPVDNYCPNCGARMDGEG